MIATSFTNGFNRREPVGQRGLKSALFLVALSTCLLCFANALGENKNTSKQRAGAEKLTHIYRSRPARRDEPLREENISDNEIRQIQAVTDDVFPGAIANISGVTTGCPCEDGPTCDSQVWVLAYQDSRYHGLLLSRIDTQWVVGPVQAWWLDYDQLLIAMRETVRAKREGFIDRYRELRKEQDKLQDSFPACDLNAVTTD